MIDWLWWLVGILGIGGVIALVLFWPFLTGTKIGRILLGVGAIVLAILGFGAKMKSVGRAEERAKLKAQINKEVDRAEVQSKRIDAMSDDEVDKELAKWDAK